VNDAVLVKDLAQRRRPEQVGQRVLHRGIADHQRGQRFLLDRRRHGGLRIFDRMLDGGPCFGRRRRDLHRRARWRGRFAGPVLLLINVG